MAEGTYQGSFSLPIDASDWDGVGPEERALRVQALEDSLLLALHPEEMDEQLRGEAHALRARLRTVRTVEQAIEERRANWFVFF